MKKLFEISGLNVYMQVAVTLLSILIHLAVTKRETRKESPAELAFIYTIGLAGWFSIMSGLFGHIIYADQVAAGIGWPLNSGFQMELGFVSIGLGIIGFAGFWRRSFRLPFMIVKTVFMWGAGFTHILHTVKFGNQSEGNVGLIVYWDFIFPVVLWLLWIITEKGCRRSTSSSI